MHKKCERCRRDAEGCTVAFKMNHWWCREHYEKYGKYADYYVQRQKKRFYELWEIENPKLLTLQ